MKIAVCSSQISKEAAKTLLAHVDQLVFIKPCERVYPAIAAHPDIQLCPVGKNCVVVHPDMDGKTLEELEGYEIEIIQGETRLGPAYPGDIPYNAAVMETRYFHLKDKTDPVCRRELEKRGHVFIPVRQGYSKCSVLPLGDKALVSADASIEKEAEKVGVRTKKIAPGDILLPGHDYGFIGGAAGVLEEERLVFFNGDIHTHSQGKEIVDFIESEGYRHLALQKGPLEDVGSIFFLNTKTSR